MSLDSAKHFIEKLAKDHHFKNQISHAKNQKEVSEMLKRNGFNFTNEEYRRAIKMNKSAELSEQELMRIAGGAQAIAMIQEE